MTKEGTSAPRGKRARHETGGGEERVGDGLPNRGLVIQDLTHPQENRTFILSDVGTAVGVRRAVAYILKSHSGCCVSSGRWQPRLKSWNNPPETEGNTGTSTSDSEKWSLPGLILERALNRVCNKMEVSYTQRNFSVTPGFWPGNKGWFDHLLQNKYRKQSTSGM